MEKKSRWHLWLIALVLFWSLYNLAPSLFYYFQPFGQPLQQNVSEKEALGIASTWIPHAVGDYGQEIDPTTYRHDTITLLSQYSKTIEVHPLSIAFVNGSDDLLQINFDTSGDARFFANCIQQASSNAPHLSYQFTPLPSRDDEKTLYLKRTVAPSHFLNEQGHLPTRFLSFVDAHNNYTPEYRTFATSQFKLLTQIVQENSPATGSHRYASLWKSPKPLEEPQLPLLVHEAAQLHTLIEVFGLDNPLAHRLFLAANEGKTPLQQLLKKIGATLKAEELLIEKEQSALKAKGGFLSEERIDQLQQISTGRSSIENLLNQFQLIGAQIASYPVSAAPFPASNETQICTPLSNHPYLQAALFDLQQGRFQLLLHEDLNSLLSATAPSYQKDLLQRLLLEHASLLSNVSNCSIKLDQRGTGTEGQASLLCSLYQTPGCSSLLLLDLDSLGSQEITRTIEQLKLLWNPQHKELKDSLYPLYDFKTYMAQPAQNQAFCLLTYQNASDENIVNFEPGSLYIVLRGLPQILDKYTASGTSSETQQLQKDVTHLLRLLESYGYQMKGDGLALGSSSALTLGSKDLILEKRHFFEPLLLSTREKFHPLMHNHYAALELTNLKERIHTDNTIADEIQENLLLLKNQYEGAKVSLNPLDKLYHLPPQKNALWNNITISWSKYFHGDERKIVKWGLDLSGGKVVQIILRDTQERLITSPDALNKAKNELTRRLNRLGVSEIAIRQEGNGLTLEFPGSQHLSAKELIQAAQLRFHVVNEKFASSHLRKDATYAKEVDAFLREVWNFAATQGSMQSKELTAIAAQLLNQASLSEATTPAKILYNAGLRFPNEEESFQTASLNQELSFIAPYRDTANYGALPIAILFYNYALEGGSLEDINVSRDPTEGFGLTFTVKEKNTLPSGEITYPQETLYSWTSQYSQEKIASTVNQTATNGEGWRLAMLLDGEIISSPVLKAALKDRASLTGRFSQHSAQQLANDLKAGSLSFTPEILSEMNISSELGASDRQHGIIAAFFGFLAIIAVMCYYYRFAGVIASAALFFNLLILAAALQSLGAALTLPGIAAIVLTLGMAVDANVLVFERLREEVASGKRFPLALKLSYRRAFSAIFDSNLTTLLAAFILLQFDSGPIKGLALTLIIGLASSMFTSLLVTQGFFQIAIDSFGLNGIHFRELFKNTKFPFLVHTKKLLYAGAICLVMGALSLSQLGKESLSIDFTGGYAVNLFIKPHANTQGTDYRETVLSIFNAEGISREMAQVRQLNRENYLRVEFSPGLQNVVENEGSKYLTAKEGSTWLLNLLEKNGLILENHRVEALSSHWTQIGGQFSEYMTQNALWGLLSAFLAILLYLTLRFEMSYALSALVALIHDVVITGALMMVAIFLGLPIKIDVTVIAALLTIIGYSLNNTIVIFDRVREDRNKTIRKLPSAAFEISLNSTLSRTVLTTATTQVALLALLFAGGSSILPFSLTMVLGTIVGTFSSLLLAPSLALRFDQMISSSK